MSEIAAFDQTNFLTAFERLSQLESGQELIVRAGKEVIDKLASQASTELKHLGVDGPDWAVVFLAAHIVSLMDLNTFPPKDEDVAFVKRVKEEMGIPDACAIARAERPRSNWFAKIKPIFTPWKPFA